MNKAKNLVTEYYTRMNDLCPTLSVHSRNLSRLYMEGRLDPCYHREELLTRMQKILLRKNKANILLTGVAGCGKTALAEGLAAVLAERKIAYEDACLQAKKEYQAAKRKWKKAVEQGSDMPEPVYVAPPKPYLCDCVIYDLSLNALVSGTKYRGEFEEKVQMVIDECKRRPEVILFIDEIHHSCRVGSAENCESVGQILKPALARNDIRVIGATTTEEKGIIAKDKALMRRFCELEIPQLVGEAAKDMARRIMEHYALFHGIQLHASADELLTQVTYFLPNTVFPDNFINVVDETLAGAVFDGVDVVTMSHFNAVLSRMTGQMILTVDSSVA